MAATPMPWYVRVADPVNRTMLRLGIPMGPNQLLTTRGRRSGHPRTVPVAVLECEGRRWVIGAYGTVNWVRNLRAAGEATLRIGRRSLQVQARELDPQEAAKVGREVLAPYLNGLLWIGRVWVPRHLMDDPEAALRHHPVFELEGSG
jgi:deazaflavin-dependent oxidoreductase (nitroreductase family)